jgi:hypothetical protein
MPLYVQAESRIPKSLFYPWSNVDNGQKAPINHVPGAWAVDRNHKQKSGSYTAPLNRNTLPADVISPYEGDARGPLKERKKP